MWGRNIRSREESMYNSRGMSVPDVFEEQWRRIDIFLDLTMAFGIYSPFAFGNILCPLPLETSILEG